MDATIQVSADLETMATLTEKQSPEIIKEQLSPATRFALPPTSKMGHNQIGMESESGGFRFRLNHSSLVTVPLVATAPLHPMWKTIFGVIDSDQGLNSVMRAHMFGKRQSPRFVTWVSNNLDQEKWKFHTLFPPKEGEGG